MNIIIFFAASHHLYSKHNLHKQTKLACSYKFVGTHKTGNQQKIEIAVGNRNIGILLEYTGIHRKHLSKIRIINLYQAETET